MTSIYACSREELAALLEGEPRFRVDQVLRGLWIEGLGLEEITTVPKSLRHRLGELFMPSLSVASEVRSDRGATRKWVFRLENGSTIETVLMRYDERVTVCVSSQAGCAMGCSFCATGQAGFSGQLGPGEILEQVMFAARAAAPERLSNVVFMGMGEPLANFAATVTALRRLHEYRGLSARHLTVSTVGVAPAIERLAREGLALTLAVSLHAANDAARSELIPLNRRYPLERLRAACAYWRATTGRRLSFEWALIDGVNDRGSDAEELAAFARPLAAHVNLIPLNPTPGYLGRGTPPAGVAAFAQDLLARGVNATVRANRGTDIDAACGQLAARKGPATAPASIGRRRVPH